MTFSIVCNIYKECVNTNIIFSAFLLCHFPPGRHGAVVMETIKKGIHDADAEARSVARK